MRQADRKSRGFPSPTTAMGTALLCRGSVEQSVGPTDGAVQGPAALGPNGIDRPAYLGTELYLGMLKRSSITVLSIVAGALLTACVAMMLLSPIHGLRQYASMVIWCSIGAGVIGGCMVASSLAFRRSDDVQLRLTVYPMRPDLERLDRLEGERGALFGLLVFVAAIIAGAIGVGLFSLA